MLAVCIFLSAAGGFDVDAVEKAAKTDLAGKLHLEGPAAADLETPKGLRGVSGGGVRTWGSGSTRSEVDENYSLPVAANRTLWIFLTLLGLIVAGILFLKFFRGDSLKRHFGKGLSSKEDPFRGHSESSPVGIFQINSNGAYSYVNISWQIITGKTVKEAYKSRWWEIIHPEDRQRVRAGWVESENAEKEFITDCRILDTRGNVRWTQIRSKVFFHDTGKTIIGTLEDITVRKEAEEDLKHYARELQRSNQDLEDFVSIASHDLQEPLRKAMIFGDRVDMSVSTNNPEDTRRHIDRLQSTLLQMQGLIDDLLQYSKVARRNESLTSVDLNEIVRETLLALDDQIRGCQGQVKVQSLPTIETDSFQMLQLFQNMISNGLKFHKENEPPVVTLSSRKCGEGFWEIVVQDNGIGMEGKYFGRIFKPFERLHPQGKYGGTGMGLAICRKVVTHLKGTIAVQSDPNRGTTFVITLPEKQKTKSLPGNKIQATTTAPTH